MVKTQQIVGLAFAGLSLAGLDGCKRKTEIKPETVIENGITLPVHNVSYAFGCTSITHCPETEIQVSGHKHAVFAQLQSVKPDGGAIYNVVETAPGPFAMAWQDFASKPNDPLTHQKHGNTAAAGQITLSADKGVPVDVHDKNGQTVRHLYKSVTFELVGHDQDPARYDGSPDTRIMTFTDFGQNAQADISGQVQPAALKNPAAIQIKSGAIQVYQHN